MDQTTASGTVSPAPPRLPRPIPVPTPTSRPFRAALAEHRICDHPADDGGQGVTMLRYRPAR